MPAVLVRSNGRSPPVSRTQRMRRNSEYVAGAKSKFAEQERLESFFQFFQRVHRTQRHVAPIFLVYDTSSYHIFNARQRDRVLIRPYSLISKHVRIKANVCMIAIVVGRPGVGALSL